MLVCSMDGTVAYLDFSLDELGDPLSEEEKVRHTALIMFWSSGHFLAAELKMSHLIGQPNHFFP